MPLLDATLFDLGALDTLAGGDSAIHRLDARTKVVVTLAFLAAVVSFSPYALSGLLPFGLYPVVVISLAGLPWRPLLKKLLWAAPLVLGVGVANLFFDRQTLFTLGPWEVPAGWVAFLSLALRLTLCVLATLALVATTGVAGIGRALERLGVPRVLTTQLLLLHRYLFVLSAEAGRMLRAWRLRARQQLKSPDLKTFGTMAGQLLLRSLDRSERVHQAMLCRGFAGRMPDAGAERLGAADLLFVLGCGGAFVLLRLCNLPQWLGALLSGGQP